MTAGILSWCVQDDVLEGLTCRQEVHRQCMPQGHRLKPEVLPTPILVLPAPDNPNKTVEERLKDLFTQEHESPGPDAMLHCEGCK